MVGWGRFFLSTFVNREKNLILYENYVKGTISDSVVYTNGFIILAIFTLSPPSVTDSPYLKLFDFSDLLRFAPNSYFQIEELFFFEMMCIYPLNEQLAGS